MTSFFFQNEETQKKIRYNLNPILNVSFGFKYHENDFLNDQEMKRKILSYIDSLNEELEAHENPAKSTNEEINIHEFRMKNGWLVRMDNKYFSITAPNYKDWISFFELSKNIFEKITQIHPVKSYDGLFLNFVDIIEPKKLKVPPVWGDLVNNHLLGAASFVSNDKLNSIYNVIEIMLDENDALMLELQHGTVFSLLDGERKNGYLLDMKFIYEKPVEQDKVFDSLKTLSKYSCQLFRWCISERLHQALVPNYL